MTSSFTILERTFRPLSLLSAGQRRGVPAKCGIYLLVDNEIIVYVGSSIDIDIRLAQHSADLGHPTPRRRKVWDRALWLALPAKVHRYYEGALIRALRPKHNRHAPRSCGYDNEILDGLGLPVHADERAVARAWLDVRRGRVVAAWRDQHSVGRSQ